MKKTLFSLLSASALLCSTSCSDEAVVPELGGETTVSFGIELNENTGSRAAIDPSTVGIDQLCYEVYKVSNNGTKTTKLEAFDVVEDQFLSNVQLALVEGQTYKVVFWAQNKDAYVIDESDNLQAINVIRNGKAIEDAFTCVVEVTAAPGASCKAVLTRPFAQVNFATTAQDWDHAVAAGFESGETSIKIENVATKFNALTGEISEYQEEITVNATATDTDFKVAGKDYKRLASALVLAPEKTEDGAAGTVTNLTFTVTPAEGAPITHEVPNAPICRNYRTNVLGGLLTRQTDVTVELQDWADVDGKYGFIDGKAYVEVKTPEEFNAEFANPNVDIVRLVDDITLAKDVTLAVAATKTIDLNGKTLSATTEVSASNREMFLVKGALTVKNGTITYEHKGQNMGWGSMTAIFDVTAGGVLNLEGVTAKNLGGSDMGFVAHLNNWGEVTLNVENSTLESNYVAVRVFNSGPNKNNVTIKNSTLKGGSYAFWVHNYTVEDFGTEAKAEAQKALLNLNIYNQGNTFSPDVNGIRYGFTNSVKSDAYGITKSVSEDGTEVTLGSLVEDGLIRRCVAGDEENTTIKKAIVGEGVTTLYDRTFRRFYALETVELPNTLTTIGAAGSGVFQSCTALKNIVLPDSVTVLGKGTFQECSSLTSINIPAGVTRIEENCLRATGLVSVEFHAGVTYFGAQAFRDCKQLKEVYINAPEFTIEANAFGVMSGTLPGTTIYVANAEMKTYLESTLDYKNQFTIVAPNSASNAEELSEALAKGENVVMTQDIDTVAATTAPYGNKYAFKLDGGVIDGNGHELHMECYGDDYGIMTSGGTVKNLTIKEGCRAIMIMYPQSDVILDNVNIGGDGVLYPINTGEGGAEGVNLIVTNSVLAGWTSYGIIESASFTNVEFKQGTYYNNIYGRVFKPYVNTTLKNCKFVAHMNLDLSSLTAGHKITMKDCTVNGQAVTASVFTIPTTDAQYDTELFTIDLPSWASSINDCVVFE